MTETCPECGRVDITNKDNLKDAIKEAITELKQDEMTAIEVYDRLNPGGEGGINARYRDKKIEMLKALRDFLQREFGWQTLKVSKDMVDIYCGSAPGSNQR